MENKEVFTEVSELKRWAEDVRKKIGSSFKYEISSIYSIPEYNMFIACFNVESPAMSSRDVKRIIREEADKYKDGRLYFMAYNDLEGVMILLFYSFYLNDIGFDDETTVKILDPIG